MQPPCGAAMPSAVPPNLPAGTLHFKVGTVGEASCTSFYLARAAARIHRARARVRISRERKAGRTFLRCGVAAEHRIFLSALRPRFEFFFFRAAP
ncbi:hypothetical protein NDU88_009293 [Pleurodeles waltl]|uniref:Uncharacterized protein n=1 Tax=Pleurodeles waltl TaxID=8319 RepID=A0AAV7QR66_PLEWA|nr:hypothetical protein NDU88_009293 [Pleurodeles waltl]